MDKIFRGVMEPNTLSTEQKLKVIRMIEHSGTQVHRSDEVKAVVSVSLHYWLHLNSSTQDTEICSAIFKSWSTNNIETMLEVVALELVDVTSRSIGSVDLSQVCCLLNQCLSVCLSSPNNPTHRHIDSKQSESSSEEQEDLQLKAQFDNFKSVMSTQVVSALVSQSTTMKSLSAVATLLLDHSDIIPWDKVALLTCTLIEQQAVAKPGLTATDGHKAFIQHALQVSKLIKNLWFKSPSLSHKQIILISLQTLFGIVSGTRELDQVSVALSTVLQNVPQSMIEEVCNNLVKDPNVRDEQISNALRHMIDWLKWPRHLTLHLWIIQIICGLAQGDRLIILFEIIDETAAGVASKLWCKNIQSTVFQVLSTMLLFHQKCPQAFLNCIPILVQAFEQIEDGDIRTKLSQLIQTLMYMHPGYPELYNPLTSLLADYEILTESYMQDTLTKYASATYTNKSKRMSAPSSTSLFEERVDKVGLENLGNTCFLNAVVQALYNIDTFQSHILTTEICSTSILCQLQTLFAFLHITQRASYSPEGFVKASLPSWFVVGEQQDSSEYMRYILDSIHEEVRQRQIQAQHKPEERHQQPPQPPLNDYTFYFTGNDTVVTKCDNCSAKNSTQQKFYDISLHFADDAGSGALVSLTDMLNNAFKEEQLCGDNQFYCESCAGLQDATRTLSDFSLPSCLVLTLCRFSYSAKLGKHTKIRTPVQYPSNLELVNKNYRLNAVIVHSGTSLNGGHYYTYGSSLVAPEQWYLFNDSRVTQCTSPAQMSNTHSKNSRLSSDTPYILFYTDIASVQAVPQVQRVVCPSMRQLVVKDDLLVMRQLRAAEEKRTTRKKACQNSSISWCSYTDDDDSPPGAPPPGADQSLDLSGSRFIF